MKPSPKVEINGRTSTVGTKAGRIDSAAATLRDEHQSDFDLVVDLKQMGVVLEANSTARPFNSGN